MIIQLLSKQFGISSNILMNYKIREMINLFEGVQVPAEVTRKRADAFVMIGGGSKMEYFEGNEAVNVIHDFLKQEKEERKGIHGTVANKGIVRGRVKLIPPDYYFDFGRLKYIMEEMMVGDVLVAETTSPELMPACRKASAIVTNQGGLLSHAAIVAREMRKPCVIGTKIATKVLRDGDLVEVDAERGVVKILKRV